MAGTKLLYFSLAAVKKVATSVCSTRLMSSTGVDLGGGGGGGAQKK